MEGANIEEKPNNQFAHSAKKTFVITIFVPLPTYKRIKARSMTRNLLVLSVLGSLLFPFKPLKAQSITDFVRYDSIEVYANSQQLLNPWAGGINFTQVSEIDLDMDGVNDLFVFDRSGNKITTYLNLGNANQSDYVLAPQYISAFPLLHDWALLRDYNCDGKMDIFTCSIAGFSIYKNVSTISGGLQFQLEEFLVNTNRSPNSTNFFGNLFVSTVDVPAIRDIDGDGDLDILTFQNGGNQIEYHKGMSMELYGTCDSISFEVGTNCWGEILENALNAGIFLDTGCQAVPIVRHFSDDVYSTLHTAHSGSCLECINTDGDNDQDVVIGDISSVDFAYLRNAGNNTFAHIDYVDQFFPTYNAPVQQNIYNCGFHIDLNNDGLKDLIITPNAIGSSENFTGMMYYQNTGRNDSVILVYQENDFLQKTMLDFGEGSYPVFFDYDNDGDMDLLVGNMGYFSSTPPYVSEIALLKNIGSTSFPTYTLLTRDFADIHVNNPSIVGMAPAFGDLDGDGDKDLLIGDNAGHLHFFRKDPGPADNFVLAQANYQSIDVGSYSKPQLIDVDRDGLIDLLVGEESGNLNYFRNTGTAAAPIFTMTSGFFGGVDVRQPGYTTGYTYPCLYNDASNNYVLLVGSERGYVYRYDNIDGNLAGTFTKTDSTYISDREGGTLGVTVTDLNNDGLTDAVIGNYAGGLTFFYGDINVSTGAIYSIATPVFTVYPNPAGEQITIRTEDFLSGKLVLTIHDVSGKLLAQEKITQQLTNIDIAHLPVGVYFCTMTDAAGFSTNHKLVISR